MRDRAAALNAKVTAVNRVHAHANRLQRTLREFFQPYLGEKVLKKDGSLLALIHDRLPNLDIGDHRMHIFRYRSDYTLSWTVKTSEEIVGTHGCLYYEVTINIGDIEGGNTLSRLTPPCKYRTDFTAEEIAEKRAKHEAAKKAADAARGELYPFGESDS